MAASEWLGRIVAIIEKILPLQLSGYNIWAICAGILVIAVTFLAMFFFTASKIKQKVLPSPSSSKPRYRFRKREKIAFYGNKMLRKVKSFTRNTIRIDTGPGRSKIKKRELIARIAKRLLSKKESKPTLKQIEPSQFFLEADIEAQDNESQLPPEVLHILRSVRVFGHFEKPLFLDICKHIETHFVSAGEYLFQRGDPDDSIYVVQSGHLNVYIYEDGADFHVKDVITGESIQSLLSVLDILTGHEAPYKTVSAKAVIDSTILRVPITSFNEILEKYPESLVRIVQVIMVRCQRVTFMALHNYLGLSHELINAKNLTDMKFSVHQLSTRISPTKSSKFSSSDTSIETVIRVNTDTGQTEKTDTESGAAPKKRSPAEETSDFEAVLSRARVDSANVGSPTAFKQSFPDTQAGLSKQKIRKLTSNTSIEEELSTKEYILDCCRADICKLFGLKDESLLQGKLNLHTVMAGSEIAKQGDQDAKLVFVVKGYLQVLQQIVGKESEETSLFIAHPGEMVGSLAVLTGEPNFFSIRAKNKATLIFISKEDFYSIMRDYPRVVLNVAHSFSKRMSPFVRQIDFALDWCYTEAARPVYKQDEPSDSLYIILNGRLRLVTTQITGKKELSAEYGRGELVGIVEVLTQANRLSTCFAVRDTELAKLPSNLLNLIKRKYPRIVTRLIHLLSHRMLGSSQQKPDPAYSLPEHSMVEQRPMVSNVTTVAIVPISNDVPISNFTMELQYALSGIGRALRLTSNIITSRLGATALDSINEYRTSSWLAQQEDLNKIVLYECDFQLTTWTHRCIRQADCILIIGLADKDPKVGRIEKQLENVAVRAQKELILLHKESAPSHRHAADWLNIRGWVSSNHHIRCPKRVFSRKPREVVREIYGKLEATEPDRHTDFSRLARFLTGTSVGLVLGGGGARGIAHVGIMKALLEHGVPIDMVGGTSIGSFIGALWSEHTDMTPFIQQAREWSADMSVMWKKLLDLTYPITSMFKGGGFNVSIERTFKDRQIEDLWIPYFCITTDITASKMKVHRTGSLWRYVRSSMSLAGYLPPLCDPIDGNLLLDGGYVNNLPADVMKDMGAKTIFAIDVGSADEKDLTNYGDELSGWWLLWKRWNPWASTVKVPTMSDIQSRLAYVSSVRQMENIIKHGICEYIRPPVEQYGTLQFGSFDEIFAVGYNHGKTYFSTLAKSDQLDKMLFRQSSLENVHAKQSKTKATADVSFTDLAELVSHISDPQIDLGFSDIDDDDVDDDELVALVTMTMSDPAADKENPRIKPKITSGSEGSLLRRKKSRSILSVEKQAQPDTQHGHRPQTQATTSPAPAPAPGGGGTI